MPFLRSRFEPPRQADRWRAGPIRTGSIIDTFVRIGSVLALSAGQRPWVSQATGDAKEIALSSRRRCGYQAIEVTQMSGASRRSSCAVWNSPQLQRLIRYPQQDMYHTNPHTTHAKRSDGASRLIGQLPPSQASQSSNLRRRRGLYRTESTTVEQKLGVSGMKLFNFRPSVGIPGRLINERNSKL
ncbi:hypothetical protein Bbelb_099650 [Branchiostoma belcheri]|nr:hypothetical protein Bbelb_099650 [Branchiostoma belcheri]